VIEPTDANTGLPPLDEPVERDTIWAALMHSGQADVLSPVDGSPRGCMVLSVRGLVQGIQGAPSDWGQIHIAIPHGSVGRLRAHIDAYLQQHPED
jgi:hypothetical protein